MLITLAEVLDEGLTKRILDDLDLELFNFYMSTEFGGIASECPAHEGLHVNADQLILECLDDENEPVKPGTPGTVVVTSLYAFTMPLIRYCLDDICRPFEGQCSCGAAFPLISPPIGRLDDVIQLPSGRIMSPSTFFDVVNLVHGIDQFRAIQDSLDHILLRLVPWEHPGKDVLAQLLSQLVELLGEPVRLDIEIVDSIEKGPDKFRRFISKLPKHEGQMNEGGTEE
jgi:phenylacetate-CoA ligase